MEILSEVGFEFVSNCLFMRYIFMLITAFQGKYMYELFCEWNDSTAKVLMTI